MNASLISDISPWRGSRGALIKCNPSSLLASPGARRQDGALSSALHLPMLCVLAAILLGAQQLRVLAQTNCEVPSWGLHVSGAIWVAGNCKYVVNIGCGDCPLEVCICDEGSDGKYTVTGAEAVGLQETQGAVCGGTVTSPCLRLKPASDDLVDLRPGTVTVSFQCTNCTQTFPLVTIEFRWDCCAPGQPVSGVSSVPNVCQPPPPPHVTPTTTPTQVNTGIRSPSQLKGIALLDAGGAVKAALNLGARDFGPPAGQLTLFESVPSTNLSKPCCLKYNFTNSNNEILTNYDGLRQIRNDDLFLNIVTNSAYRYALSFYPTNAITGSSGGYYTFNGAPFSTITVENTNTTGTTSNTVRVTDQDGYVSDYVYTTENGTNIWEVTTGGGLRKYRNCAYWSGGTNKMVRTEVRNTNGVLESLSTDVYITNALFGLRRLTNILGEGSTARTTSYEYWPSGMVKQVTYPGGAWVYTEHDNSQRPINMYSTYGTQGPTTNAFLCRWVEYSYSPAIVSGSGDTNNYEPMHPRRTIERLFSNEVRRTYFVALPFERRDIVCVNPGDLWDNPSNLVTITKFVSETNIFHLKVKSVLRPDGTLTLYEYATNAAQNIITTVRSGQPGDSYYTNVIDGIKTVTITGNLGQPVSETVSDIASGITLSSQTYTNYDDFNRPRKVTLIDNTSVTTDNGCCGPLNTTNRDGSVLIHRQDALKRYNSTTYSGVTSTHVYDAAGRQLRQLRDGAGITNTLRTNTWDNAGRLLNSGDALGNVTTYAESDGGLTHTTTYPDGGTRIEGHLLDGSLWKVTGTAVHPMRYTNGVESYDGYYRTWHQEIKLDSNGNDTAEWTKTYQDFAGRHYKTVHSDGATSQSFYNLKGQLVKQTDPDDVTTLFDYNPLGERVLTAIDMDRDGVIDTNGTDRITQSISTVANWNSQDSRITRSYVWATNNSAVSNLVSESIAAVNGNTSWNIAFGLTNKTQTLISTNGNVTNLVTAPDGSYTISHISNGLVRTVTRNDSAGNQLGKTTYTYDPHGRQLTVTDARNGTTTFEYNGTDQMTSVTTPAPGTGQPAQTTTNAYDWAGRVLRTRLPDGAGVTNIYSLKGELLTSCGARMYPVAYVYDAQGRRTNMTTWKNYAAQTGAAVTRWIFNDRGLLTAKVYDDGRGTTNTYTSAGRLRSRVWARGITTTYETNAAGQVFATTYSDGTTPNVTNYFDRLGRPTNIVTATESQFLTYSDSGRVLLETNAAGTLAKFSLTHGYDSLLRQTSLTVRSNAASLYSPTYAYDPRSSRLTNVADGSYSATYDYLANSPLVSQITFRSNSVTAMTTTKQYDYLNRLLRISSVPSADTAVSFDYLYNDANQRTRRTDPDSSYWLYEYDKLGQLTSGKHYWPDGTPVAGQQFEYAYDDIGNRSSTKEGGDATGAGLRSATYSANSLSQYTNRTVPGAADILGIAHASAGVSVNSDVNVYRKGEYFWKELSINNASAAVWQGVTNIAWLTGTTNTNTGSIFLPKTAEVFSHDSDGNLTNDGRFFYIWDAENRLLKAESLSTGPTASKRKVEWTFDPKGRRVRQVTSDGSSGSYVVTEDLKFFYDGWQCEAELNATNNTVIRTYLWGLDLSGTPTGAGGVGGLLAVSNLNTTPSTRFAAYDGNGNVVALASPSGAKPATYEYDPFGRTLRTSGTSANENTYRFSTKRANASTDLALYEYRNYHPHSGRWLSRDPRESQTADNSYAAFQNQCISHIDPDGRMWVGPVISKGFNVPRADSCGGWTVWWAYVLQGFPNCSGHVVQKLTFSGDYWNCRGDRVGPTAQTHPTFWEDLGHYDNSSPQQYVLDISDEPPKPRTEGTLILEREIRFYCDSTPSIDLDLAQFSPDAIPGQKTAPARLTLPLFWLLNPDEGPAFATIRIGWDCCCPTILGPRNFDPLTGTHMELDWSPRTPQTP